MNNLRGANAVAEPVRTSIANDIVCLAERIADRSQSLADRTNGKLHSVMQGDYPRACTEATKEQAEYPPLFAELRLKLQTIESSLDIIEHALNRTEL